MADGWLNKLVMMPDDRRFFGKVSAIDNEFFDIEFFQSVALREKVKLPIAAVKHTKLPTETRVFVQSGPTAALRGIHEAIGKRLAEVTPADGAEASGADPAT